MGHGDMICSLIRLPRVEDMLRVLRQEHNITIRRVNPWETSKLREFIELNFAKGWADEALIGVAAKPCSVFIAISGSTPAEILGFACYECTRRGYFGPSGVLAEERGKGIGKALLQCALRGMQELGYTYAIIGAPGPVEFYSNCCGAVPIPLPDAESKGIYGLREEPRLL